MPRIAVIINAGSGTRSDDDALVKRIEELFAAHGIVAKGRCAQTGEELVRFAAELSRSDADIIVAGGGDGTISAVAAEIIKANKILGVLPLGTLNHFSRDLDIPQNNLAEAVRMIVDGQTKGIDVGEVNGRIFLNNSSIGLYPRIVHKRDQQQHRLGRGKWPAAFWATVTIMRRHPFLDVRLRIGDELLKRRTAMVFIGNNDYEMEGFNIGRRPSLEGGKLSLYILHQTGRWGLIKLAIRSLFGKLRQAREFEELQIEECEIETRRRKSLLVAFDGEVAVMQTPLEYKIRPRTLKIIVAETETRQ
jgi:YegS/Rv2252/BmrU family lipid kinase